jgi:hypothetical protein
MLFKDPFKMIENKFSVPGLKKLYSGTFLEMQIQLDHSCRDERFVKL